MKLRNKKTGEILEDVKYIDTSLETIEIHYLDNGISRMETEKNYHSFLQNWEDYEPQKEPLIKDEKIRKAVRAWLSIQKQPITSVSILHSEDNDGFFCYRLYGYIDKARIVDGKAVVNNNLTSIDFEFRSDEEIKYERNADYAIEELCGEEEE